MPKVTFVCPGCRWTGERRCNASVCPHCGTRLIWVGDATELSRLIMANASLKEALLASEAEVLLLRAELSR